MSTLCGLSHFGWLCEVVCEVRGVCKLLKLQIVFSTWHVDTYECMTIWFHPQITSESDLGLSLFERL